MNGPDAPPLPAQPGDCPGHGEPPGAWRGPDGRWSFRVWAPKANAVRLHLPERERTLPLRVLDSDRPGWFGLDGLDAPPATRYGYLPDDRELPLPDPASRHQPDGVHDFSALFDPRAQGWTDADFRPRPLAEQVIYELHIGTFTPQGTFAAASQRLAYLRDLGVSAVELMPVAQFPGARNWGYDGVCPYAVQNSYGGPAGLARFVDAAHSLGLTVILDVVYNHLGPEGNYLPVFGPYFTRRHHTPWGEGLNFDGRQSRSVRDYFIHNALYWLRDLHLDGLRLDAVNTISDDSPTHILAELSQAVAGLSASLGRTKFLIAETDENDPRIVAPVSKGGQGQDAVWNDDYHHALHALLTGERGGYYADFGRVGHLAAACRNGFVLAGGVSRYRGRPWGRSSREVPPERFVVYSQNHDQVGNRPGGERLLTLAGPEAARLAAGLTLLGPHVALLFMGEEFGAITPFHYFTANTDPWLPDGVRKGRRAYFRLFGWDSDGADPFAPATFEASRLDWSRLDAMTGRQWLEFYRTLIDLRRRIWFGHHPDSGRRSREQDFHWLANPETIIREVETPDGWYRCFFHLGRHPWHIEIPYRRGEWRKIFDSADQRWGGPGCRAPQRLGRAGHLGCRERSLPMPRFSFTVYHSE